MIIHYDTFLFIHNTSFAFLLVSLDIYSSADLAAANTSTFKYPSDFRFNAILRHAKVLPNALSRDSPPALKRLNLAICKAGFLIYTTLIQWMLCP